ncbi:electron transfer flavoprotein subunit beta/FixA family protein [Desulfobacterales bacterium HSG17]|nr:electron transfer flavoprotein subunit beta/FixA family protein [Desulfobacterales bacterium HSG17]
MLNIVVCIKAVPDPAKADSIKIDPVKMTLIRKDIPMVLNPLDKFALEAALNLKEEKGAHIMVISMGPPKAASIVKECMALGADKGMLLSDKSFGGADAFATAYTLASGIKKLESFDVVFCGMASSDGATEWVGPQIASFLDTPVVTMVNTIEENETQTWTVKADFDNGYRRVKVQLPAVFTVTRHLNQPRTLSFSGIIKARKKQVEILDLEQLGVDNKKMGANGSPTIVSKMETTQNKRKITMIQGTLEEKADTVFKLLKESGCLAK